MAKSILFVDDEPRVLDGLQRSLRGMRNEWDMHFATGGPAALKAIQARAFDVVISDMKMPGVDGAALLAEVRRAHPHTMRIILSGHADPRAVVEATGQTHQYLTKPCDPEEIKQAIARTDWLKELIANREIAEVLTGIENLPSAPSSCSAVHAQLADPNCSLSKITEIISGDIGMSLTVLKLVNSAFFGVSKSVLSIENALALLGIDVLKSLFAVHELFEPCDYASKYLTNIEALNKHGILTAQIARRIASHHGFEPTQIEDIFTAAVLHDAGALAAAIYLPDAYLELCDTSGEITDYDESVERAVLGATHAEIGAYLIGLWGLPDSLITAVAFHENPAAADATTFTVPGVIHVANKLALTPKLKTADEQRIGLDLDYLDRAGVIDQLPRWLALARDCSAQPITQTHC